MVFNVDSWRRREGSVDGHDAVPVRPRTSSSRRCALASTRTRRRSSSTSCASSARSRRRSRRASAAAGRRRRLGVESAAAFDSLCADEGEGARASTWRRFRSRVRGAGTGGGGGGGGGGARLAAAGGPPPNPGNPTGMAALTRWTGGRFPRAFDFIQQQRRRYMLITQMAELLKDVDMYVLPARAGQCDIGLHAQTGHPCAVVPYKFEPPTSRPFAGGRPDTTRADRVQPAADLRRARRESLQQ